MVYTHHFVLDLSRVFFCLIEDFNISEADAIDIVDLLSMYDPITDAISDFVELTTSDSDSYLAVDVDGGANYFVTMVKIEGTTSLGTVEDLVNNGHLIVT